MTSNFAIHRLFTGMSVCPTKTLESLVYPLVPATHVHVRAACRNFARGGGGGGGGANLGYLKKRGHSYKQRQGEHWKTMFKKLVW